MLGNKMDFSSCAIWTGFHKSSHIYYSDAPSTIHVQMSFSVVLIILAQ